MTGRSLDPFQMFMDPGQTRFGLGIVFGLLDLGDVPLQFIQVVIVKYTVLHHVFRPSLPFLQSQNPRRSTTATPAVLLNQERQIRPKSVRKTWYISLF